MIKAIFFDIDGTLFSHKTKCIPKDTLETLTSLHNKGVKLFVSTGRHYLEAINLPVRDFPFDGYVTLNGQICTDGSGNTLHAIPFDPAGTQALADIFRQKRFPLTLLEEKKCYINFIDDAVQKSHGSLSIPLPEVDTYENHPLFQGIAFFEKGEEQDFCALLPESCKITRWHDYGVDVLSRDGGKSKGIQFFCAHLGIDREETMAFGDGENDMDMLQYVGIGVAMGNGNAKVKEIADYVTTDIDDGGIKNAIAHFDNLFE